MTGTEREIVELRTALVDAAEYLRALTIDTLDARATRRARAQIQKIRRALRLSDALHNARAAK